ncbi:MAG: hypothetical protein K2M00_03615 [Muribaculaceae bacterium]|nr:hypothetical protein [Muribaculaceae bacterium]
MENKETNTPLTEVQDASDILARAKANSKRILTLSIFIFVVLAAALIWFFVARSNAAKADEAIGRAEIEQNDSIALQLYKEAATMGHKSGNRAKLEVGIRLYQQHDYQGALEYLKDASVGDNIIAAGALTLEGDCYVNLQNYSDALRAYDKAVKAADKNPAIVPLILIKKAQVYRAQKDYEGEYKAYKQIMDDYPSYDNSAQFDVRKYYERAKAAAGK